MASSQKHQFCVVAKRADGVHTDAIKVYFSAVSGRVRPSTLKAFPVLSTAFANEARAYDRLRLLASSGKNAGAIMTREPRLG